MDSSGLKYKSIDELQSHCSIPRDLSQKLERRDCEYVYKSMQNLIKSADSARGDTELQYERYMKAGEVANIIRHHRSFEQFRKQKNLELTFGQDFDKCIKNLSELQTLLTRKYDEQKLRLDKIGRANSLSNSNPKLDSPEKTKTILNPAPDTNRQNPLTITPKDLIRMVEKDEVKKSAIIFDYRRNKSESIKYRNDNCITVIQIAHEMIEPSMIFSKMRNNLAVAQRSLLNRLSDVDYVVLMDDETPELINGRPDYGTKAFTMIKALTDYIGNDYRTKQRPMFMEGGFRMWKNQYPTYTSSEKVSTPRMSRDELDDVIQIYKRDDSLASIEFPDLSTPIGASEAKKPKDVIRPSIPMRDSTNVPPNQPYNTNSPVESPQIKLERPGFGVAATPGIPSRPYPPPPQSSAGLPPGSNGAIERPGGPIFGPGPVPQRPQLPNGTTTNIPIQPTQPVIPDRTAKPTVFGVNAQNNNIRIEATGDRKISEQRRPPTLDRGTKPALITHERENALLMIYEQAISTIARSGSRRNGSAPGMTGLYNMGNTCFMSATLQCLFHTPYLQDVFTKENFLSKVNPLNKMGTKGVISSVFSALNDLVWSGQFLAIRPQRFLHLFADEVNSSLADGQQHDASEFQLFLLDALHEDTNQVVNRIGFEQNYKGGERIALEANDFTAKSHKFAYSPVNKIFSVVTVSELKCCSCSESSATFEDSTLISVELSNMTASGQFVLDECLRSHFSQTKLDGDSRWNCPRCKSAQPAVRRTRLWDLPSVLVIHLKRFSFVNGEYVKNTAPVHFETQRFDPSSCMHELAPKDHKSAYRLYAVTNHSGRLNSGHYTAVASHLHTNKWLRFDDETVTPTDVTSIDTRAAYILFYKKV